VAERSASCTIRFTPGTLWIRGLVSPRENRTLWSGENFVWFFKFYSEYTQTYRLLQLLCTIPSLHAYIGGLGTVLCTGDERRVRRLIIQLCTAWWWDRQAETCRSWSVKNHCNSKKGAYLLDYVVTNWSCLVEFTTFLPSFSELTTVYSSTSTQLSRYEYHQLFS
jgi:hypothetical protein